MRISKKVEAELIERFESSFDCIKTLDRVPFHIKRAAAVEAASTAFEYLKERA